VKELADMFAEEFGRAGLQNAGEGICQQILIIVRIAIQ
jgi:hypothetical protein